MARWAMKALSIVIVFNLAFYNAKAIDEKHHDSELNRKMGERLFDGLIQLGEGTKACSQCHNNAILDTMNWNPSLANIALKAKMLGVEGLKSTLLSPNGAKLEEVHRNYKLSEEQLRQIETYLLAIGDHHENQVKPSINKILFFLLLGLLMALALLDLFFTKRIKYKAIHLLVILFGVGLQVQMLFDEGVKLGRSQNYMPDQPIKFSHKIHAGDNKIDCMYCHSDVEKGKSAGIPSANICMNCHVIVREGSKSGKFEIAKIVSAVDSGKSIEWIRIHSLPDHVYFNHSQHVKVGKVTCQECHGDVSKMDIVKQEKDLSMGWCLNCHRTKNIKIGENGYYKHTFQALQKAGKDSLSVARMGGEDCMKCHY